MKTIKQIMKEKGFKVSEKEVTEKFDKNNNIIWEKLFNGDITEWKYDKNNNLIWRKYSDGIEYWYENDDTLKLKEGKYYLNDVELVKE